MEQIQQGKAGNSEEYKFYSNVAGLVERRKESGKTTMNLELKAIPTNRNAVMVNLTEAVPPDEIRSEVDEETSTAAEVKGSSKLETLLTQKILPKCESVIKSKCDVDVKNDASEKTPIPDSDATVVTAAKPKADLAPVTPSVKSNEKGAKVATVEKMQESETLKSVTKNPSAASRVSAREKKPSLKTRITELPETDETLDLSSLKCLKCHMSYSSKKTLLYHFQMRHSKLRTFFPCPYCSNIFFYFWGLTRHMQKIHNKSKNQIDKMRDKLRQRAFTKSITKSCNIAKDQLQFIADDEDDPHVVDTGLSEASSTSKPSKQQQQQQQQQTPSNQASKSCSSSKAKVASAEKNAKNSYVNDYQTPKIHKEPRVSLKEGLRNSKEKQDDSKKAVVKRMSDSPRTRNPTWTEVNTKGRRLRKSDSPKSPSDDDPSPKSKERALDELQKKLTEAATVPIATRSSSGERVHSESRSSSVEWKNETATVFRSSETKTEIPESRGKPSETAAVSPKVTERRPIVSGSLQTQERALSLSEGSPGKNKKQDSSELSSKKDEVILGSKHSEPAKLTIERPGARRRQIQIGTTVVPRMLSDKLLPVENRDVIDKQKANANTKSGLSKAKIDEASVSAKQGGSSNPQKTMEEKSQSGQELSDRDADEVRARPSRRRTLTAKAQASVSDSRGKNEGTERKVQNERQADKNKIVKIDKEKAEAVSIVENKTTEKNDKQKQVENDNKQNVKYENEDIQIITINDKESKVDKSNAEENKSKSVKSDIQKNLNTPSKSASKTTRILKNTDTSEKQSCVSQGENKHCRSQLQDDQSSVIIVDDSDVEESNDVEMELSEKLSPSRSSSAERVLRSKDSVELKPISKEAKLVELKDVGETTMRLFASPPGSKPLIKHSRIKKMNEFVVRCVPQSTSTPVISLDVKASVEAVKASVEADAPLQLEEVSSGKQSEEQIHIPEKVDIADSTSQSSSDVDKDKRMTNNLISGFGNDTEGNTNEASTAKDNDVDSLNAIADDDCSVTNSEDSARSTAGTPTPRVRSFHCGCGRRFSCKVGFANHRRTCNVENSIVPPVPSRVVNKSLICDDNVSDSCPIDSAKGEEKKNIFVCQCGKQFNVKVGLSNHQRACLKNDEKPLETEKMQNDSTNVNSNSGDGKDSSAKSIFTMQSSFELFSCDKCSKVFGRKVSFMNHQQHCIEKKRDKEDDSNKPSTKSFSNASGKKDAPNKTSGTRRKFIARKLSAFRNDAADSEDEPFAQKASSSSRTVTEERSVDHHRKRSNSGQADVEEEQDDPPKKQVRVIEEIWVDKVAGKPVEKVKSNRIYVMVAEGTGKLHCQDTKKLCDIADETNMKCLVCFQEFTSVSNLRRHAIRHLGWKRYKCKMCRFSSYNKSECNTHIIRTHSEKLRSAAATEYMIVDLNKEASRVRTQKKKQTLSERKATEMERSPEGGEGRHQRYSRLRHQQVVVQRVPEDRKKPAVREENIHNPIPHNTFNISTRNSPRKFDTRPYKMVDRMSTLCTRKSFYVKPNQRVEASHNKRRSCNSTVTSETSGGEKMDGSSGKQKRDSSTSSLERADGEKNSNRDVNSGDEEGKQDEIAENCDKMDDFESMSDTESFTRSKSQATRKHRLSSENKDTGYASDSCLARHRSPSRRHSKTKSVSSESSVQKHRKLSGGSSSSEKSCIQLGSGSGSRPMTMMSIQDMFELIKPKPRPERKSVGEIPAKTVTKTTNRNDAVVRRVSLEGAVLTRKQADAILQASDKDKTGSVKQTSSKGDNPASSDAPGKTGLGDSAKIPSSPAVRNLNKELVKDA